MALKTLGARTFAAATFAAFTLHGADIGPTPGPVAQPTGGGGMGLSRPHHPQTDPTYHEAVKRGRIQQEDEDLMVLVTAFLRVIT